MLELFVTVTDGATKESFMTWSSVFNRNIDKIKDKDFWIHTKLFPILEEVDVWFYLFLFAL